MQGDAGYPDNVIIVGLELRVIVIGCGIVVVELGVLVKSNVSVRDGMFVSVVDLVHVLGWHHRSEDQARRQGESDGRATEQSTHGRIMDG